MAWEFENVLEATLPTTTTDMLFDGRDVWVAAGQKLYCIGFWDQNSNYEGLYGGYYPNFYTPAPQLYVYATIDLSAYLGGRNLHSMSKINDKIYITDGYTSGGYTGNLSDKVFVIDIPTRTYDSTITLPTAMHCWHAAGHNKLWFVNKGQQEDDPNDRQLLYYYDTTTTTWSSGVGIPTRKQFTSTQLIWSSDGWLVVATFNSNGVMKFNTTTGAFVSQIVINRKPRHMFVNGARELFVASMDGMVSTVDTTADTYSNDYGTNAEAYGIVDDGTYIWSVIPMLARTKKSTYTDNFKYMTGLNENYSLSDDKFADAVFQQILITPSFTYDWWNGSSFDTRTVAEYIFVLSANRVHAFRNKSLHRENYIQIRGTAMIATGPEAYYGETV